MAWFVSHVYYSINRSLFTFHGAFDECTYTLVEYDIEDKVTYANRRPIYVISKSEVRFEFQTRKSNELGNDP
jgi:hypothetical protein